MKKILMFMMTFLFGVLLLSSNSYASEIVASNTPTVDKVLGAGNNQSDVSSQTEQFSTNSQNASFSASQQVGKTTMAVAENKVAAKGSEVLHLVQTIGYVVVTIVLIVAIIRLAVARSMGSSNDPNLKSAGFGPLVICAVCYVLIYTGPFLLEWFKVWSIS